MIDVLFRWPRILFWIIPLQLAFATRVELWNAQPDWIWLTLLWGALRYSPVQSFILALIVSTVSDSLAGLPIGVTAAGWVPALWLATRGREPNLPVSRFRWLLSAVAGALVSELIVQYVVTRAAGDFLPHFWRIGLPSVIYTSFFALARSLFPPFGERE